VQRPEHDKLPLTALSRLRANGVLLPGWRSRRLLRSPSSTHRRSDVCSKQASTWAKRDLQQATSLPPRGGQRNQPRHNHLGGATQPVLETPPLAASCFCHTAQPQRQDSTNGTSLLQRPVQLTSDSLRPAFLSLAMGSCALCLTHQTNDCGKRSSLTLRVSRQGPQLVQESCLWPHTHPCSRSYSFSFFLEAPQEHTHRAGPGWQSSFAQRVT